MPELPEVEIIKRDLSSTLISKKITSTFVGDKKLKRIIPQLSVLNHSTILNRHVS
jgi:formamidopyrimidine-DNA glycosylase